jgi:hypothetical protein
VKDNLTLIAAATGGFMLSVALAGIIHGAPITASSLQARHSVNSTPVAELSLANADTEKSIKKNNDR